MVTLLPLGLLMLVQMAIQHFERKAQSTLSTQEKARLLDVSSGSSLLHMVPPTIALLVFGGFLYLKPSISVMTIGLAVYVLFMAISFFIAHGLMVKKLAAIGLPNGYVAHRKRTSIIQTVSMVVFISWILWSSISMLNGLDRSRSRANYAERL